MKEKQKSRKDEKSTEAGKCILKEKDCMQCKIADCPEERT